MAYVIFFTDNGSPSYRRVGGRDDAVATVEHLRNDLEVTDAEIHHLSPVPLTFKTYYRVQVPADDESAPEQVPAVPQQAQHPVPAAQSPVPAASIAFADEADVGPPVPGLMPLDSGSSASSGTPASSDELRPELSDDPFVLVPALQPDESFAGFIPEAGADPDPEHSMGYFTS